MNLTFHPFSIKNRFGYYTVGKYHTYSKLDAIENSKKTGNTVVWHFNDEVFDNVDWTHDPEPSLWDLYSLRAQQIREKYDYLVLFYSGGADSNNILNAFVRNGIHLDEIIQWTNYEATGDKNNNWNAEVFRVAAPTTTKIIDDYKLKTRHRLVDMSKLLTTLDKTIPEEEEWIYGKNSYFSPNMRASTLMRRNTRDYQELIDQGKKVCFVWGCEKPMIINTYNSINKKYVPAVIFQDRVDHCVSVRDQVENLEWVHDELFYWTPDLPLLPVKQAHAINNFFKTATKDHPFLTTERQTWGSTQIDGKFYYLTANGLNQLIYPYWDPDTFSIGKNPSVVISARDYWLMDNNNTIKKMTMHALGKTQKIAGDHWSGMKWGLKHFHSPAYNLTAGAELNTICGPYNVPVNTKFIRTRSSIIVR
jgi:hypothetical protein